MDKKGKCRITIIAVFLVTFTYVLIKNDFWISVAISFFASSGSSAQTSATVPHLSPLPVIISAVQQPVQKAVVPEQVVTAAVPNPANSTAMDQNPVKTCLQMGDFSNADKAQSLVNRLKEKGFSSAMKEAITLHNGEIVQRVAVCQMMTKNEALAMRARLTSAFYRYPRIKRCGNEKQA